MMEPRLQRQLAALDVMFWRARQLRAVTSVWLGAAGVGALIFLAQYFAGWPVRWPWVLLVLLAMVLSVWRWKKAGARASNFQALIASLEHAHPELRNLLSAAAEQQPNPETGRFDFLQQRVIQEVVNHKRKVLWKQELEVALFGAKNKHAGALALFFAVVFFGFQSEIRPRLTAARLVDGFEIVPGDAELERGNSLLITARFGEKPPANVTLIWNSVSGEKQRIPMERTLADPVFGASVRAVDANALYRVEYDSRVTRDFKITVFELPELNRADASLEFPIYTGLTNRTIPETRRISAVEGTRLDYVLQLNKPVARARLVHPSRSIDLDTRSNATALLSNFTITNSTRFTLELVDANGRTNRNRWEFVIESLTNRVPALRWTFPKGDQRVSRLEEMQLQAEVSDDFGVIRYGLGYGLAGSAPTILESGTALAANEKKTFGHLLALEPLNAQIDDLISYFAWADDYGPDGQIRRSYSDMFFAEVRPFEEIFRQDQSGGGGAGESQGQQPQTPTTKLAELQKQIVIATWKLQRETKPTR